MKSSIALKSRSRFATRASSMNSKPVLACGASRASTKLDGLEAAMAPTRWRLHEFHALGRRRSALIAFTSGTTGKPKATVHFHRDVLTICETVADGVLRLQPDDIVAGAAPFGFTYGLGSLLLFPIWRGASALLLGALHGGNILVECLRRFPITTLMIGPTPLSLAAAAARRRGFCDAAIVLLVGRAFAGFRLRGLARANRL